MKRSLVLIIISILLAQCSDVNVASDMIPKSQVVWCNNEISKLKYFDEALDNDVDILSKYTEEQALDLYNSYQYFSTTSNLIYGQPVSTSIIRLFEIELNMNLEKFPENTTGLEEAADFCTTWYQAQNS